MDPIYFHAKRVNARFLALVECAKDEYEDKDLRDEARYMIANWPKTHTFCIKNDANTVRVTWAKVFKGDSDTAADTFSRKEGKKIAQQKMDRLISNPPRNMLTLDRYNSQLKIAAEVDGDEHKDANTKEFMFDHLPACVADTLPWYLGRALTYFKIDDNKVIIIEGSTAKEDHPTWKEARKRVLLISDKDFILSM